MSFNESDHPSQPHDSDATFVTPNFFWPDRSWFCFDGPPRYVLDDWNVVQDNNLYDIPGVFYNSFDGYYNGWTSWLDKFQKDYRFGAMSDTNSQANVFPEVKDPWMFTEHVMHGTGLSSYQDDAKPVTKGIVTPPLINPMLVDRVYKDADDDENAKLTESSLRYLNDQRATFMRREHQVTYDLESKWRSAPDPITNERREHWESELNALGWRDKNSDGTTNTKFDRLQTQRRVVNYAVETLNSGVRIFRERVFSQANNWGASHNVPERTLSLTAPKSFVKPSEIFTGKIVPVVTIEWGVPLYDNIPDASSGGQYVIRYELYGATAAMKIGLFKRSLSGTEGDPAALFTYDLNPGNMNGSLQVPTPKNAQNTLLWNPADYDTDDLVHRGCQFWVGKKDATAENPNPNVGTCRCTYYTSQIASFGVLWEKNVTYTAGNDLVGLIDVDPYLDSQQTLQVEFHSGQQKIDMSTAGKKVTYIKGAAGAVVQILIQQSDAGNTKPVSALAARQDGGFSVNAVATATINIRRYVKDKPYPHATLCGSFWSKQADGKADDKDTTSSTGSYSKQQYIQNGGKCPYYTPVGVRTVGSYKAQSHNDAEWANMQRGLPPGSNKVLDASAAQGVMAFTRLGAASQGVVASQLYSLNSQFSHNEDISEDYQRVVVTFEPETKSLAGREIYYNTPDGKPPYSNSENAQRIRESTGFNMLDDYGTNPMGGVDTPFYGFVNQINYRVARNVQHCYKPEKCDSIITSANGAPGWRRGRYSNINFAQSALLMPGFPGIDGTDRYCHTGNSRCPYNNPDRRAAEYDNNYKVLVTEILQPFRVAGVAAFSSYGIQEAFLLPDGTIKFLGPGATLPDGQAPSDYLHNICVAVRPESTKLPVLGHYLPKTKDEFGNSYRIYFYYDKPSDDPNHRLASVAAHIVQFDDDNNPCYMPAPNEEDQVTAWKAMFGSEHTAPWLVELYDNYQSPTGFAVSVTNQNPFTGGRAPEYKDYSKIGKMIMCYTGGTTDITYTAGVNSNQFGGHPEDRAGRTGQYRSSYWVDKDGEWILDGRKIGVGEGFVQPRPRMHSKPGVYGNRWPIDGRPGLSIQDPTGENNTGTLGKGDGSWASQGYVYSNDTSAFLDWLATVWADYLPDDPNSDGKINIVVPDCNRDMLPRERKWFRCSVCGIDFPQEEIRFIKSQQVEVRDLPEAAKRMVPVPSGTDPKSKRMLYALPTGTIIKASGNNNPAECCCPTYDGGVIQLVAASGGSYDRFMNTYARGFTDVWAPPGTTVDHTGYFWKEPTLINRMHQDQAFGKLGKYNAGNSGGYSLSGYSEDNEKMGRLPITTAYQYQVGITEQITAPWAMPGQTVAQVRQFIKDAFHLLPTDSVYVQRGAIENTQSVDDEQSFVLKLSDIISFVRDNTQWGGTGMDRIGLPIICTATASQIILTQDLIKNDPAKPKPEDFTDDDQGRLLYRDAIRKWAVGIVYGSLQDWSSNTYMKANALAEALTLRGRNPDLARQFDPRENEPNYKDIDERLIDAYGDSEAGGLKMMSILNLKRLRNRVLPMLAYTIPSSSRYSAGGDYYGRMQASHNDRFSLTAKTLPLAQYGTIPPQVMAATENGIDYYVEWNLGDFTNDTARAYYPVGTTWWRIDQRVGAIKRSGGKNWLHLDDSTAGPSGYIPYTGDNVKSTCTLFMHGMLPMDKEIERAFLIFTPGDAPQMDAIGCQGQYDGNEGNVNAYGDLINSHYVGNSFCYWQHYHGYTTNHEKAIPGTYWGLDAKLHVEAGHIGKGCIDVVYAGGTVTVCNYFANNNMLDDPSNTEPFAEIEEVEPQVVPQEMEYKPFIDGGTAKLYTPHMDLMGMTFEDTGHGFGLTQGFLDTWTWGQDLKQKMTEYQIWKEWDTATYNKFANRYHVHAQASVNTYESVLSFEYFGSYFRNTHWPEQTQSIPGWFNYGGYDSSGRFQKTLSMEKQTYDSSWGNGDQVVVQADGGTGSVSSSQGGTSATIEGGGNGSQQAGNVAKVLNITDTIKRLYNDRVDRFYTCNLGVRFDDLFDLIAGRTDTNLKQKPENHQGMNDPEWFWNYRYIVSGSNYKWGMWLTDPWHHPAIVNGQQLMGDADGDPIPQSAQDKLARVVSVTDWDKQDQTGPATDDKIEVPGQGKYYQYHPFALCGTDTQDFKEDSDDSKSPIPQDDNTHYWRIKSGTPDTNSFVMSLQQNPYETERRPWRYQSGSLDSTNALCPNIACYVHQHGWTVGQFIQMATSNWGIHVIPSITSKYCANCGTELIGWIMKDSDGILTVNYDTAEGTDPIIHAVEAKTDHDSWNSQVHHGFSVDYFNTTLGQWRTLFAVDYSEVTKKFTWLEWDGQTWATKTNANLPSVFKGCEGSAGRPKDPSNSIGMHFVSIPATQVRFNVTRPGVLPCYFPNTNDATQFQQVNPSDLNKNYIDVDQSLLIHNPNNTNDDGLPTDPADYVQRKITFRESTDFSTARTYTIISASLDATTSKVRIWVGGEISLASDQYQIAWKQYITRCTRFRVYGFPWRPDDLTITDPGYVQPFYFGTGTSALRLNAWPSQVSNVTCNVGDGAQVKMDENEDGPILPNNKPNPAFLWTVTKDKFGGRDLLRITAGMWYYDYKSNQIVLPSSYIDPDTNKPVSIWAMNQALYNDVNELFSLKTLPNFVQVEYITGLGMSVDVNVQSCGSGPSYQLEPESICYVVAVNGNGQDMIGKIPDSSFKSDDLPNIGSSVKLTQRGGEKMVMNWYCYNRDPIIWGGQMSWVVGDELFNTSGKGAWGDDQIWNFFTGNLGTNLADLGLPNGKDNQNNPRYKGQTSPIGGKAGGKVTLYGSPNTILSGNLVVAAKAVTQRTYNIPGQDPVVTYERTGGMRCGFFTFRLDVTDSPSGGQYGSRTGITSGVPTVLIYARERRLTDNLEK